MFQTKDVKCELCGKETKKYQCYINRAKHLFCSFRCRTIFYNARNLGRHYKAPAKDKDGYLRQWCHIRKRFVGVHRLVMEKHLGRFLLTEEDVHHIDHNRTNNNLLNLEILNHNYHAKQHRQKKI